MLNDKLIVISKFPKYHQVPYLDLVFYKQYSEFTFKAIKNGKFQRFIKWLLKKEEISKERITQIGIGVFPFRDGDGKWVIGKCTRKGEIKIFPKKRSVCLKIASSLGRKTFFSYVKTRAIAALIHELLHLKYLKDERKVRALTKKYFKLYDQNRTLPSATNLLFPRFSS